MIYCIHPLAYKHASFSSDNLLKLGVLLYVNVKIDIQWRQIDNWPKVGDALYREPELISERIQYLFCSWLALSTVQVNRRKNIVSGISLGWSPHTQHAFTFRFWIWHHWHIIHMHNTYLENTILFSSTFWNCSVYIHLDWFIRFHSFV